MASSLPAPSPSPTEAERRRSQRVLLVAPVKIAWKTDDDSFSHEAETEVVNAHGALLRMKATPPSLTSVELIHPKTGRVASARIVKMIPRKADGYVRMAVELEIPSYDFWGVVIPRGPAPS